MRDAQSQARVSVRDLARRFDGARPAQTPLQFEAANPRRRASVLNVNIRLKQIQQRQQQRDESESAFSFINQAPSANQRPDFGGVLSEAAEATFYYPELAAALASGSEQFINKAVLRALFQEVAVDRLAQIDVLLIEYLGREDELFAKLLDAYSGIKRVVVEEDVQAKRPSGIWRISELDRLEQELRQREWLEKELEASQ